MAGFTNEEETQAGLADNAPWLLEDATAPISMGPDLFFDGLRFDCGRVAEYLERFAISALRVRIDELAETNS